MLWDDCLQRLLLRSPKRIGSVENSVNEIQDFILGQNVFVMQIFDDDAEFIMDVIIVAIISETICGHKRFNGLYVGDRICRNVVLLDCAV